jgi:hypothetical protein
MSQKNLSTSSDLAPNLIVYGLLNRQRKAAWFARKHAVLAVQAARQLQLNVAPISNGKAADLLKRLPQGRIHANGRNFLPSVRKDVYDRVVAFAGAVAGTSGSPGAAGSGAAGRQWRVGFCRRRRFASVSVPPQLARDCCWPPCDRPGR